MAPIAQQLSEGKMERGCDRRQQSVIKNGGKLYCGQGERWSQTYSTFLLRLEGWWFTCFLPCSSCVQSLHSWLHSYHSAPPSQGRNATTVRAHCSAENNIMTFLKAFMCRVVGGETPHCISLKKKHTAAASDGPKRPEIITRKVAVMIFMTCDDL